MQQYILALDQGTTSSRAIVFGRDGRAVASAQQEFEQILPGPGLVEHDPEAIWDIATRRRPRGTREGVALGREHRRHRRHQPARDDDPLGPPDRPARGQRHRLAKPRQRRDLRPAQGRRASKPIFRAKTGLVLDAYFSGTKIKHLLDTHDGLRARAERGEILFGTVDTWLLWRLTGGRRHVTDYSNASRTLLFNIHTLEWDDELLRLLDVPRAMLPEVRPSSEVYGETDARVVRRADSHRRATPATSRPPPSARPASSPAWPRTPTAPAASC